MVYAEGVSRLPADAAKCALALLLVERTMSETIVLPLQAAAELHNVLVRKGNVSRAEAGRRVRLWCARSELVTTDPAVLEEALDLSSAHRLQLFDAVILAASARAGCDLLLSEDMHDGFVWRGMTIINPFSPTPDSRLSAFLAP